MKKYSSAAVVILATSSTSSDATRQAADTTAGIGHEEHFIGGSSSTATAKATVTPIYNGYCMGCDNWKRINDDGHGNSLRSVSVAIKKLGRVVAQNRSTYEHKRSKESSTNNNDALIDPSTTTNSVVDEISLAAEERLPLLNKYPPPMKEDNDIFFSTPSQQPAGSSTLSTGLAVHNMVTEPYNNDITRLFQENELLRERLELLREIELREKINLLRIGLSNALNENGSTASSSSSSNNMMASSEEESHILIEQVLINMLKSNEEREKQLFYQMTLTIFLVGSLLVALVYIHNQNHQGQGQKELQVTTGGSTDLIIPAMCPASPTESLGSITEEGGTTSLREESKILRNQLELMRAIGPNGVIHEDQEYDGSVLSDASFSVDHDRRWWRFGIRPQSQQRPIVKGLDRVKADAAAASQVSKNQLLNTAPAGAGVTDDGESSISQPQPRWGWGRKKIDVDEGVSNDKRSSMGDDTSDDDRSQASLSSMGIAASIDYQLKMMSENS